MYTLFTFAVVATSSFLFGTSHALTARIIHQFPNPTWLENIVATRNGSLLVSIIGKPEVHIINLLTTPSTASLVAEVPEVNAVFGITELSDGVFAIAAGNYTSDNAPIPGSFSVWSIDLTSKHGAAKIDKLADAPNLSMINGLAALSKRSLLLADSWAGKIASVDTRTGKTETWFEDASTASDFSAPGLPLGVNGIKVHDEWVYYTNTVRNSLCRVPFDASAGKVAGQVETLMEGAKIAVPDDIVVLGDGSVILGRPLSNELAHVDTNGVLRILIKGEGVEGVTAVTLGRTRKDKRVAYLSSMGGFNADGTVKAGGKVIAVNLK